MRWDRQAAEFQALLEHPDFSSWWGATVPMMATPPASSSRRSRRLGTSGSPTRRSRRQGRDQPRRGGGHSFHDQRHLRGKTRFSSSTSTAWAPTRRQMATGSQDDVYRVEIEGSRRSPRKPPFGSPTAAAGCATAGCLATGCAPSTRSCGQRPPGGMDHPSTYRSSRHRDHSLRAAGGSGSDRERMTALRSSSRASSTKGNGRTIAQWVGEGGAKANSAATGGT